MTDRKIHVGRPSLPPLEEFVPYLEQIWSSQVLSNGGPLHQALELALADRLGVPHLSLFCNGTVALQTALQALDLTGEVITTPYSFVATTHALAARGLAPVFVDIDPESFNLDPDAIEAAITERTTAILPVHCYGRPCATDRIQRVADRHGLRVLYDAAHAFGVEDQGGGILRHGDLSVISFHATKVFNTFEGGAVVSPDAATKERIDRLKNFGLGPGHPVTEVGGNGKMSELHAAFGLLQLRHVDDALQRRAVLAARYRQLLAGIGGLHMPGPSTARQDNHSHFPVLVDDGFPCSRDQLDERLQAAGIQARRYFHPVIADLPVYRDLPSAAPGGLAVARRLSAQVLCLPLHPALSEDDQDHVVHEIRRAARAVP